MEASDFSQIFAACSTDANMENEIPSRSTQPSEAGETWKTCTEPSKVIEMFYSEGNYYHYGNMEKLVELAKTSPKNVRDTLSRLRKKDERSGKPVPLPPRQSYEFDDVQRHLLEKAFQESPQLDTDGSRELSSITGLTVKQINNWFCNQRRKADGRSAEKDKKRRERIREEMRRNGLGRVGTFPQETVELFEKEYEIMMQLAVIGGGKVRIPYGDLVEKTGMDRKKIRDWFSKRKGRDKRNQKNSINVTIGYEENPYTKTIDTVEQQKNRAHSTENEPLTSQEIPPASQQQTILSIFNNLFQALQNNSTTATV